ncbi:hypothetical protein AGMMS50293_04660 [Spirochaetia bacterium]|nr:hypothetical protein AGMMS50293_04660 [Spirochaetia bacterium]
MKKLKNWIPIFLLFVLLSHAPVYGQTGFSLGAGPELNIITLEEKSVALGGLINAGNRFGPVFAAGLNISAAYGWNNFIGIETRAFGRWYFVRPGIMEFFFQGDAGVLVTLRPSDPKESRGSPSIGLTLGTRIVLPGNWYLEPYIRGGYPFLGGAGILLGFSPSPKKNESSQAESSQTQTTPGNFQTLEGLEAGGNMIPRQDLISIPQIAALAIEPYIYFASDVANYNGLDLETVENNYRLLREIAAFLRVNSEYQLVIEGHANPVLNSYNEEEPSLNSLSVERAEVVANTLISYGIERKRLIIAGSGGVKTLVPWTDRQHWNLNRRVEFTVFQQNKRKTR